MAKILETSLIECRGELAMIGALQLLAVVAYPRDWSKRDQFMMAVGREGVTSWKRRHMVKRTPASHKELAASMPAEDAAAVVDRGLDLISYRVLGAGAYGWTPFMGGHVRVRREDMENCGLYRESQRRVPASFTRSLGMFSASGGIADRTLWRHWPDTAPVLHLASVVQQTMQRRKSLFELLESAPDWLCSGLIRAEKLRHMMTVGHPKLPDIREQIRLIPAK